ncbi:MAG TPA: HD-GYP domain-containing protein [Gammaproteobacteria bacterium]|nr:HD-GYP domain-containing protein [Gammaproteobacteria bacterium]
MSGELHKVAVTDLQLGMYVAQLDRPWTDTPFLFQGFYLHHDDEIDLIRRFCQHVFVDGERSQGSPEPEAESRTITRVTNLRWPTPGKPQPSGARKRVEYARSAPIEYEMPAARAIYEENVKAAEDVLKRLRETGYLNLELVQQTVSQVMDSVLRNPDTMVWLSRLRHHDEYVYQHSINSCIWGLAFARHLGLDRQSIYEIGLGAMLQDVGKTSLPSLLLSKPGPLSDAEMRVMRSHVEHSVNIMRNTPGVTGRMIDMVRAHHERFDGSGYPDGLKGNQIPTFAKIGAMVDCYDALISPRPYAQALSPHHALREIYKWRGNLFQPEVVEQFIQAVGVYPTGTLVELNTGAVGVVISQNDSRRLRPRVMLVLDEKKHPLPRFETVDLLHDDVWSDVRKFWIERHVSADSYGIDPQSLYI